MYALSKKSASSHSAPLQLNNNQSLREYSCTLFFIAKINSEEEQHQCYHKFYQTHNHTLNTRFVSSHQRADPVQSYVTCTHHHVQVRHISVAIMLITTHMNRRQQYYKICRIQTRSSSLNTTAITARQTNAVTSRITCVHNITAHK